MKREMVLIQKRCHYELFYIVKFKYSIHNKEDYIKIQDSMKIGKLGIHEKFKKILMLLIRYIHTISHFIYLHRLTF